MSYKVETIEDKKIIIRNTNNDKGIEFYIEFIHQDNYYVGRPGSSYVYLWNFNKWDATIAWIRDNTKLFIKKYKLIDKLGEYEDLIVDLLENYESYIDKDKKENLYSIRHMLNSFRLRCVDEHKGMSESEIVVTNDFISFVAKLTKSIKVGKMIKYNKENK